MKHTKIEWADHTFNPWIGCTKVGQGCDNCYAESDFDKRRHVVSWGAGQPRKRTADSTWAAPLRWNREAAAAGVRHRVFCASLADVFDNEVPDQWRADLFGLINKTPHLDWLLLTKRVGNASKMLADIRHNSDQELSVLDMMPWPNVWIGATITNQAEADRDIPKLMRVPAYRHFLSIEPMLGQIDLKLMQYEDSDHLDEQGRIIANTRRRLINWVIVGGESGPGARPMHPDWVRSLRDQCQAAGVPFLFKQWGEWVPMLGQVDGVPVRDKATTTDGWVMGLAGKKAAGRLLDGREWNEVPV